MLRAVTQADRRVETFMRFYQSVLLACCLFILPCTGLASDVKPLRFGIMPFNSTLALFKAHQPLRQYLQNSLGRQVEFYTASDYETFLHESLRGQFDMLITGPHFAVMSLTSGYQPLFHYKAALQPVFVVHKDASIARLSDLKGKRIGLSSRLSISSIGGIKWMQDNNLKVGRDFQLVEKPTHGAAVAAVAVGELDAALTTHTPLKQIPDDVRVKTRILVTDIKTPHLMTLVHERLGAATVEQIRAALAHFPSTPEGKSFFHETGYLGYEPVNTVDIKSLQPFVELTRTILNQKGR